MRLTENFDLVEFQISQMGIRNKIDNRVPPIYMDNVKRLARCLQEIRDVVDRPVVITSGYRTPRLNKLVGGVPYSHHTTGQAADIICPGLSAYELATAIVNHMDEGRFVVRPGQVILEYDAWVHVGIAEVEPARRLLTYREVHDQSVITHGIVAV